MLSQPSVVRLGVRLEREQEVFTSGLPRSPSELTLHLCRFAFEKGELIDCPVQKIAVELALLSLLNRFLRVIRSVQCKIIKCEVAILTTEFGSSRNDSHCVSAAAFSYCPSSA